jgi:hypothetical protein
MIPRWLWFVLGLLLLLLILCWLGVFPPRQGGEIVTARTVACPEHKIAIDTAAGHPPVTNIPVASSIDEIPEYHDCQRLVVNKDYGPLVAIWIAGAADTLFTTQAPAVRGPGVGPTAPRITARNLAYAIAELHSWGPETYAPLNIQPGFSCLYLWGDPQNPAVWRGWLRWQGNNPESCLKPVPIESLVEAPNVTDMVVRRTTFPTMVSADIPPVARWDREPTGDRSHYIGVRCGEGWCEVARNASFVSSSAAGAGGPLAEIKDQIEELPGAVGLPALTTRKRERVLAVKGWYDQQELAVITAGVPTLSGVTGTIVPHPILDTLDGTKVKGVFQDRWIPSAYIHVDGDYVGNHLKLDEGLNRLYLCQGSAEQCGVDLTQGEVDKCVAESAPEGTWWAMLVLARGETVYRCVTRDHKAGGVIPAGAARWRWLEHDETTWVRCEGGCCSGQ